MVMKTQTLSKFIYLKPHRLRYFERYICMHIIFDCLLVCTYAVYQRVPKKEDHNLYLLFVLQIIYIYIYIYMCVCVIFKYDIMDCR